MKLWYILYINNIIVIHHAALLEKMRLLVADIMCQNSIRSFCISASSHNVRQPLNPNTRSTAHLCTVSDFLSTYSENANTSSIQLWICYKFKKTVRWLQKLKKSLNWRFEKQTNQTLPKSETEVSLQILTAVWPWLHLNFWCSPPSASLSTRPYNNCILHTEKNKLHPSVHKLTSLSSE